MIQQNNVVTMHYTVSSPDAVEIDSSRNGKPLVFMHGRGFLVQGLEEALSDKSKGDSFNVTIPPEKAYGERHENLMQAVPKSMFEGMDVEVGMSFRATTDGGDQSVTIIDVSDDEVVVDGNHPLAGIELTFDVEIVDVREATEEEIAHGHVHGEGGVNH
ncbi:FKBP-type peptidyl-prolyl cis-trans isomerase [Alteromonas oceanisediminis]|uniref:FKBP-type peptidyl-prolyl cis-trans isomerase n=1 Tax=Alteromonas oceanisediminis TaxID=2836180 RepID=UPI001BD96892|nr:peptidylprolyl isomerase [Alteromonas oceanisediminis]MBT0585790.1 peptidylprolyl isomerase [Alteromonas oceanisediminis]